MCGDEGDGGEIGRKGGWNNEDEGMINEMRENEFWGNREEHNGEMDEWKSEKCEDDGMEGEWNENDVGWMIDEYARWWAWCKWDDERRHGMWLEWIDEQNERGDSENDDVKCEVMKWDESENEKRIERYDE